MPNTPPDKFKSGHGEKKAYEHAKPSFTGEAQENWTLETEKVNKKREEEYEARLDKFKKQHKLENIAALTKKNAELGKTIKFEAEDTLYPILTEKFKMNERTAFFVMVQMLKNGINVDLWNVDDEIKLNEDSSLELKRSGTVTKIADILQPLKAEEKKDEKPKKGEKKKAKKEEELRKEERKPTEDAEAIPDFAPEPVMPPVEPPSRGAPASPPVEARPSSPAAGAPTGSSVAPAPTTAPSVAAEAEQIAKMDKAANKLKDSLLPNLHNFFVAEIDISQQNARSIKIKTPLNFPSQPNRIVAYLTITKDDPDNYIWGGGLPVKLENTKDLQSVLDNEFNKLWQQQASEAIAKIRAKFAAVIDKSSFEYEVISIDINIFYKQKDGTRGKRIARFESSKADLLDTQFHPLIIFYVLENVTADTLKTQDAWKNRDPEKLYDDISSEIFAPNNWVIARMKKQDKTTTSSTPAAPGTPTAAPPAPAAPSTAPAAPSASAAPSAPAAPRPTLTSDQIVENRKAALKKFMEIAKEKAVKGTDFLARFDYFVNKDNKKLLVDSRNLNGVDYFVIFIKKSKTVMPIQKAKAIWIEVSKITTAADLDKAIEENKNKARLTPLGKIIQAAITDELL